MRLKREVVRGLDFYDACPRVVPQGPDLAVYTAHLFSKIHLLEIGVNIIIEEIR